MEDNKYNGWANKATWLVNLWLGETFDSLVEDIEADSREEWVSFASTTIETWTEEFIHENLAIDNGGGLITDLLNLATYGIDWDEIADTLADDHFVAEETV
jgi:hypothetical protein